KGKGTAPSRAGKTVAACDLLNRKPYLCVSSDANNAYTADDSAVLVLDLGGSDTYYNSQGGPFTAGVNGTTQVVPVSLSIDLGAERDRYMSPAAMVENAASR